MAEGILRHRLAELARDDIKVSSMGTRGVDGKAATDLAVSVCLDNNIDISMHRSRALNADEMVKSELIFVMEPVHKEFIHVFFPRVLEKTFLLGCWPGNDNRKGIIHDPVGGKYDTYKKTFQILNNHIERIIPFILAKFSHPNTCG